MERNPEKHAHGDETEMKDSRESRVTAWADVNGMLGVTKSKGACCNDKNIPQVCCLVAIGSQGITAFYI